MCPCYDRDQVKALTDMLQKTDLQHKAIVLLSLSIGCRLGELVGLKWDCVDFSCNPATVTIKSTLQYLNKTQGVIVGKPKTENSIRICNVPDSVTQVLKEYSMEQSTRAKELEGKWVDTGYVFTNFYGKPLNPSTPSTWLRSFLSRHKLPPLKFHGLRHTCATLLLAEKTDLSTVSELLGHSTVMTTANCYAYPTKQSKLIATVTMDQIISTCISDEKTTTIPKVSPEVEETAK